LIAVYEYPFKNEEIPSADWVYNIEIKVLSYDNSEGVIYFPWAPFSYMDKTIKDIICDPKYICF